MTTPWIGSDPWIGTDPWAHPDTSAFEGFLDVYIGGEWVPKPVFKFIGGEWVQKPVMLHNGTEWVPTYLVVMNDFVAADFESAGFA